MSESVREDWERYYFSDNAIGVVTVHEQHLARVAEILSERHRGVVFIWDVADSKRRHILRAVRHDRRKFPQGIEEKIVAAGEHINLNVAQSHPIKSGLVAWLFRWRTKPGWIFQPEQD